MRKDVKLGLAVGGVLLAVLVVYVLVVPGNGNQQGADVVLNEEGSTAADADGGVTTAQGETGSTESTLSAPSDATADATQRDRTGERSSAAGSAKAETSAGGDTGTSGATSAAGADKPTGESAGGGWNWDALVNGTEKIPSLGVATDVPANGLVRGDNTAPIARDPITTGTGQSTATAAEPTSGQPPQRDQAGTAQDTISSQNTGGIANGSNDSTSTPTSVPPAAGGKTHVVKAGESYSKISQALFGTSKYYIQIELANPNIDPTRLKPGMTITIPAIDTAKSAAPGTPAAAQIASATIEKTLDPKTEYKVQPGDNLHNISLRLYGKADRMEKIYEANKAAIGEDMARLKVGTILTLPEAPTQSVATTR